MNTGTSLHEEYFDDVYGKNDDPWDFQTSEYEQKKYKAAINALPRDVYGSAFEIGCSIGVLSEMLAPKCGNLLCVDVSDLPVKKAQESLKNYSQVTVQKMKVPAEFPDSMFDLIMLSEVGYYWSEEDLLHARQLIIDHLHPKGQLLLVHWTPFVPDYPLTGDQVHDLFLQQAGEGKALHHIKAKREEKYRLDLLEKA